MTDKGLSRDACLASNVGIRPLTFDLNPNDVTIHEPGGTTQLLSRHLKDDGDSKEQLH